MSALGSLVVKLGLDYAQYTGGLDKSEQAALAAAKRIQDTFDGMKARVAATAGAVAGGLAAGFTISAFRGIISGAIETGAALDDLRMQTGATVEALSGLVAVGKFNNMGPEQIGAAMNKLASNLASATEEGKGAGKALQALGIDFDKFKMMRPEDQMQTVAKAMAGFEDGTGKAAVAMALYGKQGAQMLPFLHDLAEVGDLQAKVSTEQAAAAANLDDNLTRLSTSGEAWKKELANGMIPALDLGAQALVDMMNGSGGLREEVRRLAADGSIKQWTTDAIKGLSYVADVGQIAWRVLQSIGKGLGGLAAALVQALSGDFRSAWDTLQASGQDMIDVFDGPTVGARFRESLDKVAASAAATGDAAAKARPSLDGFANTTDKADKAATAAKDPFDALRDSIIKATAAYQAEATAGEKLTEGQKKAIDVLDQLRTGKVRVTEAQAIQIGKDIEAMLAAEGENKAREEFIKTADAERAARMKTVQAMEQSAASAEEQNRALRDEIELIGLTDAAQLRVLQQRNEAIILTKEATLAELERASAITGTMTREQIALQAEIEALRERNGLLGARYQKTEVAKAAQEAAGEWTKFTDSIYNGLSDSLYRGFEAGKGFFKSFWDGIKNTAKTTVLKFGVQGIMTGVSGFLGLGSSAANAGTSGASTLGGIGNLASLGTNLFSSGLGSTISGAIGSGVGALFGTTAGNAALGTSLGLGAGSATAAAAAAAQAGGASAAAAASAASTGASIAGALPYIGAAVAALTLLAGSFKGETRYGGGFEVVNGKAFRTTGDVTNTLPESAIVQSVQGTFDSINKILSQYGSQFVATNIKAGIETSGKGRGGVFAGGLLSGGGATDIKFGKFFEDRIGASLSPEEAVKAFGGELNKAVIAALQAATDLPKYVQRQIESVDVNALGADKAAELLQTIGNLPNVLLQGFGTTRDALAQQFAQGLALGDATAAGQSVADTLVASIEASLYNDAAGKIFDIVNSGIVAPMLDAIATGASVSEALSQATIDKTIERAKAQASALSELFGNAEFVSALEQIRTTVGEALGQAGDAFGYTPKYQLQAAQQIDTAAQSASTAADEAARAWQQITDGLLTDRITAEIALLRAQGREEEALARERAKAIEGFDAYQIGLYDGTQAILSQVTALEKQAEATKLAQERAAELASTLASELPGATAKFLSPDQRLAAGYTGIASDLSKVGINVGADALAAASLDQIAAAAMAVYNLGSTSDETRLAILRAASGLADLKDSAAAAAEAARNAAAQQRAGLETRLLQLQGNTVELRNREVAALEPANRALQRQIFALEDLAAAQGRLDAASSAITSEYLSAQSALESAQQGVTEVTRQAAQEMLNFGNSIVEFLNQLNTTTLGNTSPESRYFAAGEQFRKTAALAQSGDRDALGRITSVATDYLGASKDYYASGSGFSMDEGAVKAALQQILGVTGSGTAASAAVDPMVKAQEELVKAMERMNEIQAIVSATGVSTSVAATDLLGAFLSAQADVAKATADEAIWRAADKAAWEARDTLQQVMTDASLITSAQTQDSGVTLDYINTSTATIQAAAQTQTTILTAMATSSAATRESSEKTAQTTEAVLNTLNAVLVENRNMASQLAALRQKVADMESNQRLAASAPAKV